MAWTDDRVAKLTKLWAEGLSASQIAAELGENVTRNAVIGKVHRLGLSGRAKSTGGGSKPRRKPAATRASSYQRTTSMRAASSGDTALKMDTQVAVETRPRPQEDAVMPISRKLTLLELTDETCKWPTGDPTMPNFSFCGHKTKEEKPYCAFHSGLAFQPPNERRRRR